MSWRAKVATNGALSRRQAMAGGGAVAGRGVREDLRQPFDHGARTCRGAAGQFRAQDVDTALQQPPHIAEVGLLALGVPAQGAQFGQAQHGQVVLGRAGGQLRGARTVTTVPAGRAVRGWHSDLTS